MVLGRTILSNGKGHFGPTNRNELTGQSGPASQFTISSCVSMCMSRYLNTWKVLESMKEA